MFDKLSLWIKPPDDNVVSAKFKESNNLKPVRLYKKITKIVDIKYIKRILIKFELKLL